MVRSGDEDSEWIVLTGGSITGKTSVANRFALEGYNISPEVAESYVDHGKSYGLGAQKAQRKGGGGPIVLNDIRTEGNYPEDEDLILDRSLGDSLYFMDRFSGTDSVDDVLMDTLFDYAKNQYDKVFWLESVEDKAGFEDDGTRTENRELAEEIHFDLKDWYEDRLDYDVTEIARNPLDRRVEDIAWHAELQPPKNSPTYPVKTGLDSFC